jgi:hypothetical protein
MRKLLIIGVVLALAGVLAGCKIVVTPGAPQGWAFLNEGANGTGVYVNGPGTPPAGRGSVLLSIDGNGREAIATNTYQGQALSSLTRLQYSTYQAFSGSPNETLILAFDVDYDSTDSSTAYQGRLVYVPSADPGNTITPRTWQTWNTQNGTTAWYSSATGASAFRPIVADQPQANPPCTQTTFCSWSDVLSNYPNARIRPSVGPLLVRAGGPVTGGFVGAADNVIVGINGNDFENNFEPGDGHVAVTAANAASLGFGFVLETATGSGSFVSGPNGADGTGSAQLTVNTTGGESLLDGLYSGTPFNRLSFLSYKTYQKDPSAHATTLQLDVDYDSTDADTTFQGRVVFEPSQAGEGPITNETWQTWNPLTSASGWWQSGTPKVGGVAVGQECTQASPCSFAHLLSTYPNASIRPITGQLNGQPVGGGIWLKAGSGWSPGFTGNVDSLTVAAKVGTVNGTATFDFEP